MKNEGYIYEVKDKFGNYKTEHVLEKDEEVIMKQLRKLNKMWKIYKSRPGGNRLILYCGGTGCEIRIDHCSSDNTIESYEHITCDGGDGGDEF